MGVETKACGGCGLELPRGAFHRNNAARDGRSWRCKECANAYAREYHRTTSSTPPLAIGTTKKCSKCGERKPMREFGKDRGKRAGRKSACLACLRGSRATHPVSVSSKACSSCGEPKPASDFPRAPGNRDGLRGQCRLCISARKRKYREGHLVAHAAHQQKRRALKAGVLHVPYNRGDILARYPLCLACGSSQNLHVDHVVPLSLGGPDEAGNLQVLCRHCNLSKHSKYHEYRPQYLLSATV